MDNPAFGDAGASATGATGSASGSGSDTDASAGPTSAAASDPLTGGSDGESESSGVDPSVTVTATTTAPGTTSDPTSGGPTTGTELECDCLNDQVCTPVGCRGGQIYLNFEGPTMIAAEVDDATLDKTQIVELAGSHKSYGGTLTDQAALVAAVQGYFAGLSVHVTGERPDAGPYTMVVLGAQLEDAGFDPDALEISIPDCGDENPNSVSFTSIVHETPLSDAQKAMVVAHAVGHAVGLEHVGGDGMGQIDVMWQAVEPDASFTVECAPLLGEWKCDTHEAHCPSGFQSSFHELADTYGTL